MKIAHVINPVIVAESSDLYVAQPVTFRAMLAAKREAIDTVDVELMAVSYADDAALLPGRFKHLPFLTRSVMDVGKFGNHRKLPLLADILTSAVAHSDADFFVYSNVDISPMPWFYSAIAQALAEHDALVINRRTIRKCDSGRQSLSFYYQQAGEPHPGFDCFVFNRSQFERYRLYDACIGANWIGRVLICNLLAQAAKPRIIDNAHLTFHLGDDRSWKTAANIDFDTHNERQVERLMRHLRHEGLHEKHDLIKRSHAEFLLKTCDPDASRPKAQPRESLAFIPLAKAGKFSRLPQTWLPSHSWEHLKNPVLRQDPVFVVGHPRSGTTLLHSLIATQVTPAIFPETHFFSLVRSLIKVDNDRIQAAGLEKTLSCIAEKLDVSEDFTNHVTRLVHERQLSPKMLFEAMVFDQLTQNPNPNEIARVRWMEKTPDHAEYLDVMRRFYPAAKFVFVVRHPEKAILSRRKHFTWNDESSWPISRHLDRWVKTIESTNAFEQKFPDQLLTVKFEDVVDCPDMEIARICDFLNVDFDNQKLLDQGKFSKQQSREWETWKADTNRDVSAEIAHGVDLCLTESERSELNQRLHQYLDQYGYSPKNGSCVGQKSANTATASNKNGSTNQPSRPHGQPMKTASPPVSDVSARVPRTPTMSSSLKALRRHGVEVNAVVDIGIFNCTPPLMKCFPDVKHYLFEPVEFHFETIKKNYAALDYELFNVALSDADGEVFLIGRSVVGGDTITHSHIQDTPISPDEHPEVLDCRRIRRAKLDTLLRDVVIKDPWLLKVDVDGHEIPILRGAEQSLCRASIVVIEAPLSKSPLPQLLERFQFLVARDFFLVDIVDMAYYDDTLSQVDLIFVRRDIVKGINQLRPFEGKDFQFDSKLWQH